jgi:hypothetical protein
MKGGLLMGLEREHLEKAFSSNSKTVNFTQDLEIQLFPERFDEFVLNEAADKGKVFAARVEAIHAGLTRNLTFYQEDSLKASAKTWTKPYNKPVLTHHNTSGEPIGRVTSAKYLQQSMLKKGFGCVEIVCEVVDPDAISKVRDGRYSTVSIGAETDSVVCSVCKTDLLKTHKWCGHWKGKRYNKEGEPDPKGKPCYWIIGNLNFDEVSFVNVPADPAAMVVGLVEEGLEVSLDEAASGVEEEEVMGDGEEVTEGVVSYQNLPLASKDRSWDEGGARNRVASWAGGPDKEKVNWSKYRKAFLWYDSGDSENFGAYKLPIADVIDGKLTAVPRGIYSAAGYLKRTKGPSDDEKASIRAHLAKYYKKLGEDPPWDKEKEEYIITVPADMPEDLKPIEELLSTDMMLGEYIESLMSIIVSNNKKIGDLQKDIDELNESKDQISSELEDCKATMEELVIEKELFTNKYDKVINDNVSLSNKYKKLVIDNILDYKVMLSLISAEERNDAEAKLNERTIESLIDSLEDLKEQFSKNITQVQNISSPGLCVSRVKTKNEEAEETSDGKDKEITAEKAVNILFNLVNGPGYRNK